MPQARDLAFPVATSRQNGPGQATFTEEVMGVRGREGSLIRELAGSSFVTG